MNAETIYASESCHYYFPDGTPCYEVPYADKKRAGEKRPTTVKDAKKLGLYPSVSTVLGIVSKPGLDGWKKEQVAKAAYGVPCGPEETEEMWVEYVLRKAEEQMNLARDTGTEIHGAIEEYFHRAREGDWTVHESPYSLHIGAAISAVRKFGVLNKPFRAEKSFTSKLGYGGKVDLRGENWIVDFKCVDRLDKKLDYPDRCQQLIAYAEGDVSTRCANIFISTSSPGEYLVREWSEEEKIKGWEIFRGCLNLWCSIYSYYPV